MSPVESETKLLITGSKKNSTTTLPCMRPPADAEPEDWHACPPRTERPLASLAAPSFSRVSRSGSRGRVQFHRQGRLGSLAGLRCGGVGCSDWSLDRKWVIRPGQQNLCKPSAPAQPTHVPVRLERLLRGILKVKGRRLTVNKC